MFTDHDFGDDGACLRVLASGSSGNCSVLVIKRAGVVRVCLIDLGLSPRRTFRMLAEMGLRPDQIDDCLLTHLDHDHFHTGWFVGLPGHATLRLHADHARDLHRTSGTLASRIRVSAFDEAFTLDDHCWVSPLSMAHDEEGVSTFRIDIDGVGANGSSVSLGFATDLGCITSDLIDHFGPRDGHEHGVDVLAIESNYCPTLQAESPRPEFLKQRIMGGRGHLSNQQSLRAIESILPREHVVLLHLSRQCNHPDVVAPLHAGADYGLTISEQERPTRWVRIGTSRRETTRRRSLAPEPSKLTVQVRAQTGSLFDQLVAGNS